MVRFVDVAKRPARAGDHETVSARDASTRIDTSSTRHASLADAMVAASLALSSSTAVWGTSAGALASRARSHAAPAPGRARVVTRAFWKKLSPADAPPARQVRDVEYVPQETMTDAYARIKKQRAKAKAKYEAKEKGGLSLFMFNALSAVNFEEDIEEDRGLLAQAKRMGKGDKMSREQYQALQRKVGGTKSGFFGENIFAKGEYLDRGYVERADEAPVQPLGKGFLYGVLAAVLATTVYVVVQVGQAGAI